MTVDELKATYAKLPSKFIKARSDTFFRVEESRPVTFFVLIGGADSFPDIAPGGYSSKGLGWVRPIGTHFLKKRIGCTNISDPNSCYICEQLKGLEEDLTVLKRDTDEVMRTDPDRGNEMLLKAQVFEKQIQGIRCQEKYAINILPKGQDIPLVYEHPRVWRGQSTRCSRPLSTRTGLTSLTPCRRLLSLSRRSAKVSPPNTR
jgi:hypothetical protein